MAGEVVAATIPLATVQSTKAQAIKAACQAAIAAGFSSSALGSAYSYPSDDNSQRNIAMAATAGGALWCETGGIWAMVIHTSAQAKQVQTDLFAMIQRNQSKYAQLVAEIDTATTSEAVEAVSW